MILGDKEASKISFFVTGFTPSLAIVAAAMESCSATKACHVVDECVGKIADACIKNGITMLLTADHGNSEVMVNAETGKPQTAHTTNKVPFVLINGPKDVQLKDDGALCNIAPTVLQLLDIKKPDEMECDSLIK